MSLFQKIQHITIGVLMILSGIVIFLFPSVSYTYVLLLLGGGLLISGLSTLIYFFTMAVYMVGGKTILYRGIIYVDFAILTFTLTDVPKIYVLIYLAVIHGFAGLVDILRARETISNGSSSWKLKMFHGILDVLVALSCIFFAKKTNTAVIIFSIGIIYSGILRIISSLRKSTFEYVR